MNPVKTRITTADYLQMPETTLPMELIDGELFELPTPFDRHQRVVGNIYFVLRPLLKIGQVRASPLDVHIAPDTVLQPDVFWIAPDSACVSKDGKYWYGAPDLTVEVLSESTATRDRREKFALYERYGTREYWLVSPTERNIEVWQRINEHFTRFGVYEVGETFDSPLLQVTIPLDAIFETK